MPIPTQLDTDRSQTASSTHPTSLQDTRPQPLELIIGMGFDATAARLALLLSQGDLPGALTFLTEGEGATQASTEADQPTLPKEAKILTPRCVEAAQLPSSAPAPAAAPAHKPEDPHSSTLPPAAGSFSPARRPGSHPEASPSRPTACVQARSSDSKQRPSSRAQQCFTALAQASSSNSPAQRPGLRGRASSHQPSSAQTAKCFRQRGP